MTNVTNHIAHLVTFFRTAFTIVLAIALGEALGRREGEQQGVLAVRRRLAAALLIAIACVAAAAGLARAAEAIPCEKVASIGVATMAADGTITMRVRSLPPGPIAEGQFTYPPTDPEYENIKKHLGGIAPGETKPVPPWC